MHQIYFQKHVRKFAFQWVFLLFGLILGLVVQRPAKCEIAEEAYLNTTLVPRTVIVLFDSRLENSPSDTLARRFVETPLNHLGLVVRYVDISSHKSPKEIFTKDVRGVITAFQFGGSPVDSERLIQLLSYAADENRKVVLLGDATFLFSRTLPSTVRAQALRLHSYLGLRSLERGAFLQPELTTSVVDQAFVRASATLEPALWNIPLVQSANDKNRIVVDAEVESSFTIQRVALAWFNHNGAVALGPTAFSEYTGSGPGYERRTWFLEPLTFFDAVLNLEELPRLDVTTQNGRRLFIALIDGPGLLSVVTADGVVTGKTSAEVLREKIIDRWPGLLFTVAPVAAELDERWVGTPASVRAARDILNRPNVRLATSGYSNVWNFQAYERERQSSANSDSKEFEEARARFSAREVSTPALAEPRQYAEGPFELKNELQGAVDLVRKMSASRSLTWDIPIVLSEQTLLSRSLEETAQKLGLAVITGGASRLDPRYPSIAWVEPISAPLETQSEPRPLFPLAGERTFTTISKQPDYAYQFAEATLAGTESPVRYRPFAIRFGIDVGQSTSRRNSVEKLLALTDKQELFPVSLAKLSSIERGLFSARIYQCGTNCWTISDRGSLSTVRFDSARDLVVDLEKSSGILGFRNYQDSLYVALDPTEGTPVVVVNRSGRLNGAALIESSCTVSRISRGKNLVSFEASCEGSGSMTWKVPWQSKSAVFIGGSERIPLKEVEQTESRTVHINLAQKREPYLVTITDEGGSI